MTQNRRGGTRALHALGFGIAFSLMLTGCGDRDPQGASPALSTRALVRVATAATPTEPSAVRRTAHVRSRSDIQLSLETTGVLTERPVPLGTTVEKGTVLFRLDDRTETQALLAAEARLALWSGDRADVAERKQAEAAVAMARTQLERRAVRAPFRGTIDHYDIDVGEFASPGRTLARLLDLKRLYVDVHVLQEEVSRLQLGLSVAIRFPQLDSNSRKATVVRIAAASLRGESRYLVELDLDEVSGVRPGFVATVEMPLMDSQSEITIPRDAIFQRFGTDRVFVVVRTGQEDIVRETVIETRERVGRPDLAEVLSGLEVGDRVVTRGRLGLSDGAAVEVEGR